MKSKPPHYKQKFGPLADLTMYASAYQLMSKRFDFAEDSSISRHLVHRIFTALQNEEQRQGIIRMNPFTLNLDHSGLNFPVSLLSNEIISKLVNGTPLPQVLRDLREQVFKQLLQHDSSVTMDQVRQILAPSELMARGQKNNSNQRIKDIEQCRMDLAKLRQEVSVPEDLVPAAEQLVEPPVSIVNQVSPVIEQEGRSPEMARSLISHLIDLRERFCPRINDLAPGQLMAVALDMRDRSMSVKMRYRAHVPVRLTLYHEAELANIERLRSKDRSALDEILARRIARLLTEAYCQGGLLTLGMVAVLTHQSTARVGKLVNKFEAEHKLILPTPGTIHDAGTKLTHKTIVIQMHLSGMECKQIARETFHTEEAVDRYIDDFERVLIAKGHGLPSFFMPRVLKLGKHVIDQYEELIAQHIGGIEEVKEILHSKGIDIQCEAA